MSSASTNYATEINAIKAYKENTDERMKTTRELVADAECLLDVAKALRAHKCLIHSFGSTDHGPEIWVQPDDEFKRSIVGKCVVIDSRTPVGEYVQIQNHVRINGVKIRWVEMQFKKPSSRGKAETTLERSDDDPKGEESSQSGGVSNGC